MRRYTIKSKKWYGWFWPPERKKIKLMQALIDLHFEEMDKKIRKEINDYLIYGEEPNYKEYKL